MLRTIGILLGLVLIGLLLLSTSLLIAFSIIGASFVPLTWLYGKLTGQSYERVCDNSEMIYQLNRIGKWTFLIFVLAIIVIILF